MDNEKIYETFRTLSTPLICDACLRRNVSIRLAPVGIRPLKDDMKVAGCVSPAKHHGSVDILLEVIGLSNAGDVLVVDNCERNDEACVGDLTALEARANGLSGIVAWGLHRDSSDLIRIGFPVFSYGSFPTGPQRLDPRAIDALEVAQFGEFSVSRNDVVFGDADGIVFVPLENTEEVLDTAKEIWVKERHQAERIESGLTLREMLRFDEYLERRASSPSYSFRRHLREVGGEMEE